MEAACCSLENKTTPAKVPAVAGLGPAGAVNDLAARRCTGQPPSSHTNTGIAHHQVQGWGRGLVKNAALSKAHSS